MSTPCSDREPLPEPDARTLFMGEQDDPELDVWRGRGLRVYDATLKPLEEHATPPPTPGSHRPNFWVYQGGAFVRCGCGTCFYGPCPSPLK